MDIASFFSEVVIVRPYGSIGVVVRSSLYRAMAAARERPRIAV
jgi:hypothetical protein